MDRLRATVMLVFLAGIGCEDSISPPPDAEIAVSADVTGTAVTMLVIEVGGAGIDPTLVFNFDVEESIASGTITVPTGSNRVVTIRGYDASAVETHRGADTIAVAEGINPALRITLQPLAGDIPVEVLIGSATLVVTPAADTIGITSTTQLSAVIEASDGSTIEGPVRWATLHPGQATVSSSGLVTGVGFGSAQIVATFGGIGGSAGILVVAAQTTLPALRLLTDALPGALLVTAPPGDTDRVFVVQQGGRVRVFRHDTLLSTPFLDLSDTITTGGELGFLGLAFHPNYAQNGFVYASYTDLNADTRIVRFRVSGDANVADRSTATHILGQPQPFSNHNGGMVAFGPDGMLYIALGDGGSGGDPQGNGQNRNTLLGKLLRIDVDAQSPYAVPQDNPLAGTAGTRPEIWAYGLRNPWRFSFDRSTGDLYVADVGQSSREEVNVRPRSSSGGENYGWVIMEGTICTPPASTCNQAGLTLPVLDYGRGDGCAVTGGYVYRGARVPILQGRYLYSDYCSGFVRSFRWQNGGVADARDWSGELDPGSLVTSFGEDARGELYITTAGGRVYRIVSAGS